MRPVHVAETKPAPSPKTSAGLDLLHPSLVLTQGLMEGEEFWGAIALPHGLSMVPFLPMVPQSVLPSFSPQIVPSLCQTHQGGPQAVRGFICQIQESPPWS